MSARPRAAGRRLLLDTSAYFALADPRDANHAAASALLHRLPTQGVRLFTTNFIVAETHALLFGRRDRTAALQVLQEIDHSTTTIVRISVADERRAREILVQYDDKDFSLTDATSFAVMERLGIDSALNVGTLPR